MKTTGFRSFVLYILLFAFLGGLVYLVLNLAVNGAKWASQPYNGHIYGSDTTVSAGTITDRDGMILAQTVDGTRVYAESESVRRSLLHTVGDSSGYISTAVQSVHRSKLVGYNPITGLNRTVLSDFGSSMQLTVDANANAAAYNAFGGRNGSAFIYNYKTGEVLVKLSAPTYDPMNVPGDLNDNEAYEGVFLDHTLSSSYTPGSIFKLVTAAAAMDYLPDWDTRTYTCEETYALGDSHVTCLNYHGELNLEQALGYSCNIYFAQLALDIGADNLQKKAEEMGFGESFSFDSVTTCKSTIDLSDASNLETAWSAVGQAEVLANPYHMALLMGAIANGGKTPEPYITGHGTGTTYTLTDSATAEALHRMMRNNVANYYGDYLFNGYTLCAKTGTAELDNQNPNCWIVGFSDDESMPYAFAVCVQEGTSGLYTAGQVVAAALDAA
ncbi:MAG: penicillin-binding transpeptidase domain-containing protein [Hominenteromicrobium sp.]